ncbi:MAG: polysaccharide biosynthesis protein [Flavobacteriaceae bacterium]|nr:MAG: polysaccharide biosynthesis protein [Flavobacteriaceae bacterium]
MLKKLMSQTLIYGLSNVLGRVFPFLLTPLLTKEFGPSFYAPFIDFYSAAGILMVVLSHGMETSIFRFVTLEKDKNKVYSTALFSIFLVCLVFVVLGLWFQDPFALWFKNPGKGNFVAWFVLILSLDALSAVPFAKLRIEEAALKFGGIKILNAVLNFVLSLFFLFALPYFVENGSNWAAMLYKPEYGIGYVFLANLLASAFTFLCLIPTLLDIPFKFDFSLWKKFMPYALPIMIAGLGGVINQSLDRQFLKYLLPASTAATQVGIYGAVYKISTFLLLFRQAYLLGIEPFFFSHAQNKDAKKTYAKLMHYFVLVNCIILLGLVANLDLLKYYLGQPKYWEGLSVVPIILIAEVFLGIYLNLSIWYKLSDKTYIGAIISLIGAFLTIVINLVFIPKYGYWASTWATFIAYFSMCAISYKWGKKHYPIKYPMKIISFYLLTSILFCILSYYLFDKNIIIGNLLLFFYLALVFVLEKDSIQKMKNEK